MSKLSTKAEIAEAGAKARLAIRKLLPIVEYWRGVELYSHSEAGREGDPAPYPTLKGDARREVLKMDRAIKAARDALSVS